MINTDKEDPIVKIQIISNYEKCYQLVKELKLNAGRYKRCL